jgi:hypothetical protein
MLSLAEFRDLVKTARKMMKMSPEERRAFEALEVRIRTILPEEYQDNYQSVEPVSMGTAALKYGRDGRVAWHDTWGSFCDLAMAGGPPHKGRLLRAASQAQIEAAPERYGAVVEEICRGIEMVAFLPASASPVPGWVRVECGSAVTAGWLARAITMENVSARCEGTWLELPAGPDYRIEKEIKNVITSIAKTCHYWQDHTGPAHQKAVGELFAAISAEAPLIQPASIGHDFQDAMDPEPGRLLAARLEQETGLKAWEGSCDGWAGVVCPSVKAAIWTMRGLVVSNVFARREETALCVPVNPASDPAGDFVARAVTRVFGFARVREVL